MSIYEPDHQWFTAFGIPITDTDDQGQYNNYPMLRIQAFDKSSGELLASTDIVVPVSDEMHCSECHSNGGEAADAATANQLGVASWSTSNNPEIQYRENVLILHDAINGTSLVADKPVMCATCHYSPALDLTGAGPQGPQTYLPSLSKAIHTRHGKTRDGQLPDAHNPAIIQENGTNSCYSCHPGSTTQCLRGAMMFSGSMMANSSPNMTSSPM